MIYIVSAITVILLWSGVSFPAVIAAPAPIPRAADTCADPSLVIPFVQAFNPGQAAYRTLSVSTYTASITFASNSGWVYQGEEFLAWPTPQDFTSPFYNLFNPTTTDHMIVLSTDGSVPSAPGYEQLDGIVGYAYATQVCSSVPLLEAVYSGGSHYYTTDPIVHSQLLLQPGWTNGAIKAYVLPLPFV
ncbi:hypothetical protein BDN70DRAFT_919913 [Pholiota conissans]|uniref:DUF5648 domain-containing protein n=1 Tax=Pholiota conissans TaxID=109636 RepID=A0A9P5Z744_9AGAR|nr:hypothetical protein BDN70DRAFT_919913 [Pholiota conissans]